MPELKHGTLNIRLTRAGLRNILNDVDAENNNKRDRTNGEANIDFAARLTTAIGMELVITRLPKTPGEFNRVVFELIESGEAIPSYEETEELKSYCDSAFYTSDEVKVVDVTYTDEKDATTFIVVNFFSQKTLPDDDDALSRWRAVFIPAFNAAMRECALDGKATTNLAVPLDHWKWFQEVLDDTLHHYNNVVLPTLRGGPLIQYTSNGAILTNSIGGIHIGNAVKVMWRRQDQERSNVAAYHVRLVIVPDK